MKRFCPECSSKGKKVKVLVKLNEGRLVGKCHECGCVFSPNTRPS